MASVTIKNIPDDLYDLLKQAASAHHRSINGEFINCLEMTLRPRPLSPAEITDSARRLRSRVDATLVDTDEIQATIHQGRE